MGEPAPVPWTVERFLEWERALPDAWEYVGGMTRMMVGGSNDHRRIGFNLAFALRTALAGSRC